MVELAEKLKEGSLSPESVFYSYMDKAYPTEFMAKWRQLRLDVIPCPMLGLAFNHGSAGKLFGCGRICELPMAVQSVALLREEELCLCFVKEVEALAHGTKRNV